MNTFRFDFKADAKTMNHLTAWREKANRSRALAPVTARLQKLLALLILLPLAAVLAQGGQGPGPLYSLPEQNRAFYLGWQGYIDTQLDFSEFFNADHTIMAWFMPQYPHAYEGPSFAENGAGTYVIGQGNYRNGDGGFKDAGNPVFLIQIGNRKAQYLVPEFQANTWAHIAVVRENNIFKLYINGSQKWPVKNIDKETNTFDWGSRIDASTVSASTLPSGTLRLGRRTSLPKFKRKGSKIPEAESKRDWQAYGLLDDVAVFNRALTHLEIPTIMNQKRLSGSESGLMAGWCFDTPEPGASLPPKLNSWRDPSPRAYHVPVSPDRNSGYDDQLFDNVFIIGETQAVLQLPFHANEEWTVGQGYDARGGSHNGTAAFSYDFSRADYAPVLASAEGKAVLYLKNSPPIDGIDVNFVTLKHATGEYVRYLHLAPNSLHPAIDGGTYDADGGYYIIPESQAPTLAQGSQIGTVGPTSNHLHWAGKSGTLLPITIPMAFSNYEVWDEAGQTWVHVLRGHPKAGQRIRRLQ